LKDRGILQGSARQHAAAGIIIGGINHKKSVETTTTPSPRTGGYQYENPIFPNYIKLQPINL